MKKFFFNLIRCTLWSITYVGSLPEPLVYLRNVLVEGRPDFEDWMLNVSVSVGCFIMYLIWLLVFSIPFTGFRKFWQVLHVDIVTIFIACLMNSVSYCAYRQIMY